MDCLGVSVKTFCALCCYAGAIKATVLHGLKISQLFNKLGAVYGIFFDDIDCIPPVLRYFLRLVISTDEMTRYLQLSFS